MRSKPARKAAAGTAARIHAKVRHSRSPAVPGVDTLQPAESVEEAESEIGVNEWVDPETGELAEGQSPPHLQED